MRYTVLLTAALCVALFSEMAAKERLTPWVAGGISASHAHLRGDCRACHKPWKGPSPERCLECHVFAVLDCRSLKEATTRGGNAADQRTEACEKPLHCAQCHQEHLELPKLVKADFSVTAVHQLGHPEYGTCMNCHTDVDHGLVLGCYFCHKGNPAKTTKDAAHAGMRAE